MKFRLNSVKSVDNTMMKKPTMKGGGNGEKFSSTIYVALSLSLSLSIYLSIYLFLSNFPCVCLSLCLSPCVSLSVCVSLHVCLSPCASFSTCLSPSVSLSLSRLSVCIQFLSLSLGLFIALCSNLVLSLFFMLFLFPLYQ